LESSKRANIDCIVVKNEFTQKQDFSKADYFINNIEELKKLL
ncbi:MAG: HAD family phosphatase, partial [Arcobacter skirrowii]|nr:HAD family phosphatase [Aliarcobacter skirrowii]